MQFQACLVLSHILLKNQRAFIGEFVHSKKIEAAGLNGESTPALKGKGKERESVDIFALAVKLFTDLDWL